MGSPVRRTQIRKREQSDPGPCRATGATPGRASQNQKRRWGLLWAKSLSWRFISTGILFLVGWAYTGSVSTGGWVALIHMVITVMLFVPHDLAWDRWVLQRGMEHRRH